MFRTNGWSAAVPISTGDSDVDDVPANNLICAEAGPIPKVAVEAVPKTTKVPGIGSNESETFPIYIRVVLLLAKAMRPCAFTLAMVSKQATEPTKRIFAAFMASLKLAVYPSTIGFLATEIVDADEPIEGRIFQAKAPARLSF